MAWIPDAGGRWIDTPAITKPHEGEARLQWHSVPREHKLPLAAGTPEVVPAAVAGLETNCLSDHAGRANEHGSGQRSRCAWRGN